MNSESVHWRERFSGWASSPGELRITWGWNGAGRSCALCEKPVTLAEIEYEIQFVRDGSSPGIDTYSLHMRCFAAWEMERTKLGTPLAPTRLHRGGSL